MGGEFSFDNNSTAYPFEFHDFYIGVRCAVPADFRMDCYSQPDWLRWAPHPVLAAQEWRVKRIDFRGSADAYHGTPPVEVSQITNRPWPTFFISAEASRLPLFTIGYLMVPLAVIWMFSYFGFFWSGDSPASR